MPLLAISRAFQSATKELSALVGYLAPERSGFRLLDRSVKYAGLYSRSVLHLDEDTVGDGKP
jgi:hypothetical protein